MDSSDRLFVDNIFKILNLKIEGCRSATIYLDAAEDIFVVATYYVHPFKMLNDTTLATTTETINVSELIRGKAA